MRVLTALALVASLAVAGCGGDKKTIPSDDGASLIRALRQVRDLSGDPQNCPQLAAAVQRVQSRVASLPSSVDKDTRDSLVNGVNHLIDNVNTECQNAQTTPTETTPTQTTPTTTETTPTQTTPTQTTPTQTTPTQTTPTQTTPTQTGPGNGGAGPGKGNGNGNGPPNAQGQDKKKDKPGKKGPG
jgi:cell division protein FtsN